MIVFEGEVTDKDCLHFLKKRQTIATLCSSIVMFCSTGLPIVLLALATYKIMYCFMFLPIVMSMGVVFAMRKGIPTQVKVSADYIRIKTKNKNLTGCIPIDEVLEVIDMGTWYRFKYNTKINILAVCQKDLIVEGTLEEFEELFADKLVRKTHEEQSSIQ